MTPVFTETMLQADKNMIKKCDVQLRGLKDNFQSAEFSETNYLFIGPHSHIKEFRH